MRRSGGPTALALSVLSVAIGLGYFGYLVATSFPPDWVRLIPFFWLAVCCVAVALAVRSVKHGRRAGYAWPALVVGILSALFAAVFALAALFGD